MNKKLRYMMLCLSLFAFGCNDWLDVQPKSQVKEEDLFSSESGFRDALTCIYALMGRVETYGGNSTMGFMDMLAQTYSKVDYDYEDALKELSDALSEQGFIPVSAGAFVGEHSYSRKDMPIAAGRPDKDDLFKASQFGHDTLKKLEEAGCLSKLSVLEVKGNYPYKVKGPSTPQAPVTDEELCTQCEYCIDVCPVAAISIVDDRMFSDPVLCIKCCACVKECPEGARTFDTPYTAMLHKNFSARREPELFF